MDLDIVQNTSKVKSRNHVFLKTEEIFEACVDALLEKDDENWLSSLRSLSYEEAIEALTQLPGIGPKVAACVCLFSLDKDEAIPVDTHVHRLALRYYR